MRKFIIVLLSIFGMAMTTRYHGESDIHSLWINIMLWACFVVCTLGFTYGLSGMFTAVLDDKFEDSL